MGPEIALVDADQGDAAESEGNYNRDGKGNGKLCEGAAALTRRQRGLVLWQGWRCGRRAHSVLRIERLLEGEESHEIGQERQQSCEAGPLDQVEAVDGGAGV